MEATSRFRKKVEKDEAYQKTIIGLGSKVEQIIRQNNAIARFYIVHILWLIYFDSSRMTNNRWVRKQSVGQIKPMKDVYEEYFIDETSAQLKQDTPT